MLPIKFIACVGAAGTGTGVVAGGAYYLIASQEGSTKRTYLLIAKDASDKKPTDEVNECISEKGCAVYKSNKIFGATDDEGEKTTFKKIKDQQKIIKHQQYVLQIDRFALKEKYFIEVEFKTNKKALFQVTSEAVLEANQKISPTLPANILPIEKLRKITSTRTFNDLTIAQKRSRKYHNDQYPTSIDRGEDVEHDDFLVFQWNDKIAENNKSYHTWTFDNDQKIDKYLFKPFNQQKDDPIDHSYLTLELNHKDQGPRGWVEIYEIKNQEALKTAFSSETNKDGTLFKPTNVEWNDIASDSQMITKISALESGKFYKLVFENFKDFKDGFQDKLNSIVLKKVFTDVTQKLFELTSDDEPLQQVCVRVASKDSETGCRFWKTKTVVVAEETAQVNGAEAGK